MRAHRFLLAAGSLLAACSSPLSSSADSAGSGDARVDDVSGDADGSASDTTPSADAVVDASDADAADDVDHVDVVDVVATDTMDAGTFDPVTDADVNVDVLEPGCAAVPPFADVGELLNPLEATHSYRLDGCRGVVHPFVAASAMKWYLRVEGVPDGTIVRVHDAYTSDVADRAPLAEAAAVSSEVALNVTTIRSGEHRIDILPPRQSGSIDYRVVARCDDGCDREATRYPIVLVHGYAGVDSYFGVLDYFFDVVPTLDDAGYLAFTPVTSPLATSERRAEQLEEQLVSIRAETGADRLNIVAHSQGGLDARVLVSGRGWADKVASITTVATPHRGIPLLLADFVSVQDFSPEFMEEFNERYKDADTVRYWSWSFRSCGILEPGCRRDSANELVDVFLGASYTLLLRFGENDGVVPTASMPWGEHLGLHFADHFDEVGQIADGSPDDDPFDHRAFYLGEAQRLREAGL